LKVSFVSSACAALCLATLVGCAQSPIPVAGNFDITEQKKVRSAGHWQVISQNAARETLKMLDEAGVASNARLSVTPPEQATSFEKTFHEMLTTELVRSGRRVTTSAQNVLQVSYKAQLVEHKSERPHFVPGLYTMLTSGVGVIYGLRNQHVDAKVAGALGFAIAADYAASINSGGPTHTELVLTTSATTPDQILTRKTDVYYIEDLDNTLFKTAPEYKTLKVVNQ
jgi:hypothetical protein